MLRGREILRSATSVLQRWPEIICVWFTNDFGKYERHLVDDRGVGAGLKESHRIIHEVKHFWVVGFFYEMKMGITNKN